MIYQTHLGFAEFFLRKARKGYEAVVRFQVRSISHEEAVVPVSGPSAALSIRGCGDHYVFVLNGKAIASMDSALLSTEVVGGFTGVTVGPFCIKGKAEFDGFDYEQEN